MQRDSYVVVILKRKHSMRVKFVLVLSSDVTLSDLSHFIVHMKPNAVAGEHNLGSYHRCLCE
jgi:hypothetical protein